MRKLNYILLGLLCLPVFFVNIRDSHDWGDDFAQYIHQAKNITEGIPQSETGYVYNEDMFLGPKAYPVGFPLLLAPVYGIYGNSIKAFNYLISALLFISCFLIFYFLRKHFSALVSILLVLILLYNPWTLRFKAEVMSEIPFMLFLVLSYILYMNREGKRFSFIIIGLCGAFLICVRNIGMVFPLAILLDTLYQWYRLRKYGPLQAIKPLFVNAGKILLALFLFYGLFLLLFPLPSGLVAYPHLADGNNFKDTVLRNLVYNVAVFEAFFSHYNVNHWDFVLYITKSCMLVFLIIGLLKSLWRPRFMELLVLLYLGAIMIFPYGDAGFRFLLPVLPFFLYYVVIGLQSINIRLPIGKGTMALLLGGFVLIQYKISDEDLFRQDDSVIVPGPQEKGSVDAFNYIRTNTDPKAVIAFCKPRALSLYAERSSVANYDKYTPEQCLKKFKETGVSYYLVQNEITDGVMINFLKQNEASIRPVWNNDKFTLYK